MIQCFSLMYFKIGCLFYFYTIAINTVESSLLAGDTWLSWVTLVHEFTSQLTYNVFIYEIELNIPTNQDNVSYPRTLTSTNKNDSTGNEISSCNY